MKKRSINSDKYYHLCADDLSKTIEIQQVGDLIKNDVVNTRTKKVIGGSYGHKAHTNPFLSSIFAVNRTEVASLLMIKDRRRYGILTAT
jgi:hypothetical protein